MDVVEPETFKTFTVLNNALIKSDDNYFIFYVTVINVPVDFFELVLTEFAACLKPPSRDNYCEASYPRTQQRDQDEGWTQIMRLESSLKRRLYPFDHAVDNIKVL